MGNTDIAIIAVIPEEYAAIRKALTEANCKLEHYPGDSGRSNLYCWATGEIRIHTGEALRVVVGATMQPGHIQMAHAVTATVSAFEPRAVLLVGIAGGFDRDGLTRGDVAISSVIYNYEYGKIADSFEPRHDHTYQSDQLLYRSAIAMHVTDDSWCKSDLHLRPQEEMGALPPKALGGVVASGNKVVDFADHAFFRSVLDSWPKLLAVEMEGAGAVSAINAATSAGSTVGFLMIRGISDMPLVSGSTSSRTHPRTNTAERDKWKNYAAAVAARYTVHWIINGWPHPARQKRPEGTEDGNAPPVQLTAPPHSRAWEASASLSIIESLVNQNTACLQALTSATREHKAAHSPNPLIASELETVERHIDEAHPELAISKIDALENSVWDELLPQQKYQLKALRSRIYMQNWEYNKAAQALLSAKQYIPETERARTNEALAYELMGDNPKAFALATSLRKEFPGSSRLAAIAIRNAPDDSTFEYLERIALPFVNFDEEVNLAIGHIALTQSRFASARSYASKAVELNHDSPHASLLLGQAFHGRGNFFDESERGRLKVAEEHYSRALALAQDQKMTRLEAAIRLNRAKLRAILRDLRAESDYIRAIELSPDNTEVRISYAAYLRESLRFDDALNELPSIREPYVAELSFLQAIVRYDRKARDDEQIALELIKSVMLLPDAHRFEDAHIAYIEWATKRTVTSEDMTFYKSTSLRERNPCLYHTLLAWALHAGGDVEGARSELVTAVANLGDDVDRDRIYLLGQILVLCDEHDKAVPILDKCCRPGILDDETKSLIGAAQKSRRHDVLTRVLEQLRIAQSTTEALLDLEIYCLQLYHPQQALMVAVDYSSKHSDCRLVNLWRSVLSLRLDTPQHLVSDPKLLPEVTQLSAERTAMVIDVLAQAGKYSDALIYAYDSVRTHFHAECVHAKYVSLFLQVYPKCTELHRNDEATVGCALKIKHEHESAERWIVIEDGMSPDISRNEFPPDHPLAVTILGRRSGETATLADGSPNGESIAICEICHKTAFRFKDTRDRYKMLFPRGNAMRMIHLGAGDTFDPSFIISLLEQQADDINKLNTLYASEPVTFFGYAEISGLNLLETWEYLTSRDNLGLRAGAGTDIAYSEASAIVSEAKTFVLDLTAVITLAQLGHLDLLSDNRYEFIVSQSLVEEFQSLQQGMIEQRGISRESVVAVDGELRRVTEPLEHHESRVALIQAIVDALKAHCNVRPCVEAAAFDPTRRDFLATILGRANFELILLANSTSSILWSDDAILRAVARSELGVQGAWSHCVLEKLLGGGSTGLEKLGRASALMAGWHYKGIRLNADSVLAALKLSNWRPDSWPFTLVAAPLLSSGPHAFKCLPIWADAIVRAWRLIPNDRRQDFIFFVLNGLDHVLLADRLWRLIAVAYKDDPLSARQLLSIVNRWKQLPSTRLKK